MKLIITVFCQSIYSFLYILLLMHVYSRVKRLTNLEQSWLGLMRETAANSFLYLILYGMIAGLIGSFLIAVLGISVDSSILVVMWPLIILFMLFNNRYLTLAYTGGVISLISLIFGVPAFNVPSFIALIAVIYLMQGLLLLMDGNRAGIPVYMEYKKYKPVGGFIIDKFWPIPVTALISPTALDLIPGKSIPMPEWWPLFSSSNGDGSLILLPLALLICYRDITVTQSVGKRTMNTGIRLIIYSMFIFVAAWISTRVDWFSYLASLLTIFLYMMLKFIGDKEQSDRNPIYGAPWRGMRILEVLPQSAGVLMGIKPGDILIKINGKDVNTREMMDEVLKNSPNFIWVEVIRNKETLTFEYRDYQYGIKNLGLMIVPRQSGRLFQLKQQRNLFGIRKHKGSF